MVDVRGAKLSVAAICVLFTGCGPDVAWGGSDGALDEPPGSSEDESDGDTSSDGRGSEDDNDNGDGDGDGDPQPEPRVIFIPDGTPVVDECSIELSPPSELEGEDFPIVVNLELSCARERFIHLELGTNLSETIVGFVTAPSELAYGVRIRDSPEFVDALPGTEFTGQAPDGTLYRSHHEYGIPTLRYLERGQDGWLDTSVPDLPQPSAGQDPHYFFSPVPNSMGELEGELRIHSGNTSSFRWASRENGQWVEEQIDSADPNTGPLHIDLDAGDRPYALTMADWTGDWSNLFVRFIGTEPVPVGAMDIKAYDMSIAGPPRPELGGPSIAALRHRDNGLELLTIEELEDWSEVPLGLGPMLSSSCGHVVDPVQGLDPCPPCEIVDSGIADGYALARSSGGRLWAAWLDIEAETAANYTLENGACRAVVDATYAGVLRVRELGVDGSVLHSFDLPQTLEYVHGWTKQWKVDMVGYGDQLALGFATRRYRLGLEIPADFRAAARIMIIDTAVFD